MEHNGSYPLTKTQAIGPRKLGISPTDKSGNVWLTRNINTSSQGEQRELERNADKLAREDIGRWRLQPKEHAFTRLRAALPTLTLKSDVFVDSELGDGIIGRLATLLRDASPALAASLQNPTLGPIIRDKARFLDAWNDYLHDAPNYDDYTAFALIPRLPGTEFPKGLAARKDLLRVITAIVFIDRIWHAETVWVDPTAFFSDIAQRSTSYEEDISKLLPLSSPVYQTEEKFAYRSAAFACHEVLRWKEKLGIMMRDTGKRVAQVGAGFSALSPFANQLVAIAEIGDSKSLQAISEANLGRAALGFLTNSGLTNVRLYKRQYSYICLACSLLPLPILGITGR